VRREVQRFHLTKPISKNTGQAEFTSTPTPCRRRTSAQRLGRGELLSLVSKDEALPDNVDTLTEEKVARSGGSVSSP
jgi:hypothetical protein